MAALSGLSAPSAEPADPAVTVACATASGALSAEQAAAREHAFSLPLADIDPSDPALFERDTVGHYFERLRRDDPVHATRSALYGRFWSVTRHADILAVDSQHEIYSSDWSQGGIAIFDTPVEQGLQSFISMDPPKHDEQRRVVVPALAPANLARLEHLIRQRTAAVLDGLPRGETFNWVERVSIELTTLMLATLFDFPLEDRRLLTHWSDVTTTPPDPGSRYESGQARWAELRQCREYFLRLWNERVNEPPRPDLISMLAHAPATRLMDKKEFLGNVLLLIVGGNDTTRNSMSGGLLALLQRPEQFARLRANPALVESLVPEIIRWQTPLAHMRRTALVDTELAGKPIRRGDKVIMWYLSGNRDAGAIENADQFIIDRAKPRQHLSFGFGIHRCVGGRLAELQLKILWQEMLQRFPVIELMGEPVRVRSNFVRGFAELPVRIPL